MNSERPAVERRTESGIHAAIKLGRETEHQLWTDITMDIATGGVFIATYVPMPLGTPVELLLMLERDEPPIAARGVVRWTRLHSDGSDGPAGVGVRFVELDAEAATRLGTFTSRVREPMLFELDEAPMRPRSRKAG
jgi:uncharacterized protein (TIGR02266 family)